MVTDVVVAVRSMGPSTPGAAARLAINAGAEELLAARGDLVICNCNSSRLAG